ncbi:prepilin-type N-terminal cleavage/methylation domain-containing protein [Candidatus Nomurabacteria bacterium]|nr:prepilin-type N-terminal cleavage/methylation domain-containing protein [Candidatus Nomurabacteria bacterium]
MIKKGFTILEILIVIAIVGTLSGIILVFVSSARTSAADSTIKSSLGSLRKEASIYFNDSSLGNGRYNTTTFLKNSVCLIPGNSFWDGTFIANGSQGEKLITQALNGRAASLSRCLMDSAGTGWAAAVTSASSNGQYFCADHYGTNKITQTGLSLLTLLQAASGNGGIPICP